MSEFRVGIVLFEGAEELDWAGPWEVFTMATMGRDDLTVGTVAQTAGPVGSSSACSVGSARGSLNCASSGFVLHERRDHQTAPAAQHTS